MNRNRWSPNYRGGEERFFELLDNPGPYALRAAFISSGLSPQVASGLVFFIDDQRHGRRLAHHGTVATYRRHLAALDPEELRELAEGDLAAAV